MTRHTQHLTCIAAIAVAALALSACNSTGDPGSNTATAATTSAPATTDVSPTASTPTPTKSPEDEAIAAAEKMIPLYFQVGDSSIAAPDKFDREELKKVAISTALDDMQNLMSAFQNQQFKASGSTEVESITNPRVDLKLDLKKSPPDVPTVQLDVCIDVSKLNVVDKDGKSIVPPSRKAHVPVNVSVLNYKYPDPAQWRVGLVTEVKDGSC